VAISCKNNDFGLEPREAALDSASTRVSVCKFLEDVKRRHSTKSDGFKDQNITLISDATKIKMQSTVTLV